MDELCDGENHARFAAGLAPNFFHAESGTTLVAICKPAGCAASKTLLIACSRADNGTLFTPLPISTIADERSAAPGNSMFSSRLAAPTWTKRTGVPSSTAFAIATITVFALSPHR